MSAILYSVGIIFMLVGAGLIPVIGLVGGFGIQIIGSVLCACGNKLTFGSYF